MNPFASRMFWAFASLPLLTVSAARADDSKKICTDAYVQAQSLRDAHKLKDSRDRLRVCSQSTCAGFIVKECTAWLLEMEGRVPSVVLSAKDSHDQPVMDVTVSMDGTPIAQKLDGQAIDVDPGPHTFTFVATDGTKVDQPYAVLEGQKAQSVTATFPASASSPAPGLGAPLHAEAQGVMPGPSEGAAFWTAQRDVGVAAAAIGVAGIAAGSVLGLLAKSAVNQQNVDCASPTVCGGHAQALSDHSTAVTDSTVSTVAFIAGGALLAGGAILFFTGGRKSEQPAPSTRIVVMPSVSLGGGGLFLRGEF